MTINTTFAAGLVVLAGTVTTVSAQLGDFTRAELNTAFIPGTGNSNTNFAINRSEEASGNIIEVGSKAKERFFGESTGGGTGARYIVQDGFSPTSGAGGAPLSSDAWWNYDFSVDLGSRLTDSVAIVFTVSNLAADPDVLTGPLPLTTETGLPAGISLFQGSQNIGFAPLDLLTNWDAFDHVDYLFELAVFDKVSSAPLGATNMTVRVIPTPASAAILGLGGLAAVRRRR